MIPFNKPHLTGKETEYIKQAVNGLKLSGNGDFTKKCHAYFKERYHVNKVLLTTSCTDALEMAAMLINIKPGDEVIVPSYTFVSSALAFTRMGAKIVFIDSKQDHPNMDVSLLEALITDKTKAIVPVHYGGVACEMDTIMDLANKHNLFVIEDAAQAIESKYKGKQLGTIGHFGCFSFHETKNIQCGEGGMLFINDKTYAERAEIIWEKGTNRASFFRGEVNKYSWVDTGSSFLPADILAAFLWAQLENLETIQERRKAIWNRYFSNLSKIDNAGFTLPKNINENNNGHVFYLVCKSSKLREELMDHLKSKGIYPVFHYLSLHKSDYMQKENTTVDLPNADYFTDGLLRLPLFVELKDVEVDEICSTIAEFKVSSPL